MRRFLNRFGGLGMANMATPCVQSRLALCEKLMPLVNSRDARDRAGLVVKDFVRNMGSNPGVLLD